MSVKMVIQQGGWDADWDKCPADRDIADFLHIENLEGKRIFHMGPGTHHHIGLTLSERNQVMSLTVSPEEVWQYIFWAIDNPKKTRNYACIFGDIYTFNFYMTAPWDIISLPHFGEMPDETRQSYSEFNDEELLDEIVRYHLRLGGLLVLYHRSSAHDRILPLVNAHERLELYKTYESIVAYKKI